MSRLSTILLLVLGMALPAGAATIEERIAAELQAQGYDIVETQRTWLGRLRIVAETDNIRREVVFNPGTGEILRDYSVLLTAPEKRERDLARTTKPPLATRAPSSPGAAVIGATDGVDDPAADTASVAPPPGDEPPDDEAVAIGDDAATDPVPDDDPSVAIPLLPPPLMPAVVE